MRFKLILSIVIANLVFVHLATILPSGQIAAEELPDIDLYDRETIYIHYGIFGDGFVKNGQIINLGPFGSNLAKEMAGSEYAFEEMSKARKYKIASTVTSLVATTFSVTGIALSLWDDDGDKRLTFEISSIVVGGVCGILAEGFNRSAMAAMNRAVWLYNRDATSKRVRDWRR